MYTLYKSGYILYNMKILLVITVVNRNLLTTIAELAVRCQTPGLCTDEVLLPYKYNIHSRIISIIKLDARRRMMSDVSLMYKQYIIAQKNRSSWNIKP